MGYYSSSDDYDDAFSIDEVRQIALGRGYRQCQHEPREGVLDFRRADSDGDSEIVRVWYRTGTVGTYIKHPTQQRTQLFRRDNTQRSQLGEFIFTFVQAWAIGLTSCFGQTPSSTTRACTPAAGTTGAANETPAANGTPRARRAAGCTAVSPTTPITTVQLDFFLYIKHGVVRPNDCPCDSSHCP